MEIDQFRSALHTRPFRPFTVVTADGERHAVGHPEMVALTPSGRTVVLFDDLGITVVDMNAITKFIVSRTKTRRGTKESE